MDSFEDLDAQLEQLQAQLKNDIQKVWFNSKSSEKTPIWTFILSLGRPCPWIPGNYKVI